MKPFILIVAMACAVASCSKKIEPQDMAPGGDTVYTDTLCTDTLCTDTLPATAGTSSTTPAPSANSTFNGVSSRNSYGDDEILGFDDDVDDDNDMDAFMNDYRDF